MTYEAPGGEDVEVGRGPAPQELPPALDLVLPPLEDPGDEGAQHGVVALADAAPGREVCVSSTRSMFYKGQAIRDSQVRN